MARKSSRKHDPDEPSGGSARSGAAARRSAGPADGEGPPLDNALLRARARGEISADDAFEALYREYAGTVAAWLSLRVDRVQVEDLAQDAWLIFYTRFRRWEFGAEMESSRSRPVLSFLFRTCHFITKGHRRLASVRLTQPHEAPEELPSDVDAAEITRRVEAGRLLELAEAICPEAELTVLQAKLAGLSAKDIAAALGITTAVVDHRYRDALARLRKKARLGSRSRGPGGASA